MDITNAVGFDLKALMSANHVTIRALGAHMDVTHARIRAIRNGEALVSLLVRQDYRQAIAELGGVSL